MNTRELVFRDTARGIVLTIIMVPGDSWQFVITHGKATYDSGKLLAVPYGFLLKLVMLIRTRQGSARLESGSLKMNVYRTRDDKYVLAFGSRTTLGTYLSLSHDELKIIAGFFGV